MADKKPGAGAVAVNQPAGEGLRQKLYQRVGEYRNAHGAKGLEINVNLQNYAQYVADRLQSGVGVGLIPADPRSPIELAKLHWWTGEKVDLVVTSPWDEGEGLQAQWDSDHAQGAALLGEAQEFGCGIGGGRHNLWAVTAIGYRANMAAETRTGEVLKVCLNEDFDCVGPALAHEEGGTHP
jgi:hypothetical protein